MSENSANNAASTDIIARDIRDEEVLQRRIQDARQRGREAVARSRAKKKSRLLELETMVEFLSEEISLLSQKLAISKIEKEAAESRKKELKDRLDKLEEIILEKSERVTKIQSL